MLRDMTSALLRDENRAETENKDSDIHIAQELHRPQQGPQDIPSDLPPLQTGKSFPIVMEFPLLLMKVGVHEGTS